MSTPTTVMVFDGQNSIVDLPPLPAMPAGVTIEFWALVDAGCREAFVFSALLRADTNDGLKISLPWQGVKVEWAANISDVYGAGDVIEKAAAPEEIKGSWAHWAFVKDVARGEMAVYRGGALWHRDTGKSQPISDRAEVHIGAYAGGRYKWIGRLAEFRIWDRARSEEEVRADMGRRLSGTEPGLVGYWPLSEVRPDDTAPDQPERKRGKARKSPNEGRLDGTTPDLTGRRPGLARGVTLTTDDGLTLAPPAGADYQAIEPITPVHLMGWRSTTSGMEDYAMWRQTLKDERLEGDPPFRRGCIWA